VYTCIILTAVLYKIELTKNYNMVIRNCIWLMSVLNDCYGYIIVPLIAFCLQFMKSATLVEYIIYWTGYAFCFLTMILATTFGRNPMKSTNPLSVLDQKSELAYIILMNLYLVLKATILKYLDN
jgi:hypothetical protein